jgi:hypothetical protein
MASGNSLAILSVSAAQIPFSVAQTVHDILTATRANINMARTERYGLASILSNAKISIRYELSCHAGATCRW